MQVFPFCSLALLVERDLASLVSSKYCLAWSTDSKELYF